MRNTIDYINDGAGRFVSAADFKMFEKIFSHETVLINGVYDFTQMSNYLYGRIIDKNQSHFSDSVSQYGTAVGSSDYKTRAFIFGSYVEGGDQFKGWTLEGIKAELKKWGITILNEGFEELLDPLNLKVELDS